MYDSPKGGRCEDQGRFGVIGGYAVEEGLRNIKEAIELHLDVEIYDLL